VFYLIRTSRWSRLGFDFALPGRARLNLSFPLDSPLRTFDGFVEDPRLISPDLSCIYVGRDPRAAPFNWREVQQKFSVLPTRTECAFLLSCGIDGPTSIIDRRSKADEYLEEEHKHWKKHASLDSERPDLVQFDEAEVAMENLGDMVLPTVGAWNLPADAFGELPEGDMTITDWEPRVIVDISKYRPRLAVFDLDTRCSTVC